MEQVLKAWPRIGILLIRGDGAMAQTDPLALIARHAEAFRKKAVQTLPVKVGAAASPLGFPAPATVVHRHYGDGLGLTENLHTYSTFRLFTTETQIRCGETQALSAKK